MTTPATSTAAVPLGGGRTRTRRLGAAFAALVLVSVPLACSDDDSDEATGTDETTETTAPDATGSGGEDDGEVDAEGEVVEVVLHDYGFRGLPEEVPAGTRLQVSNESDVELHELVAFRLPDDEERPASELIQLSEEELGAMFGGEPEPATVLIAMPGSHDQMAAVGDGVLSEPGRYLIACFIPTGADPAEYAAAAEGSDGPPQVEGGPPHFVQGMYAELQVT